MSLKSKIMNIMSTHPKLAIFGIGLLVTFVVGAIIGTIEGPQQVFAGGARWGS
jgi:hypothetical protein